MSERIVVSFRGVIPPGGEQTYLERALDLKKRAEAHGATLCAWSALTFSFEFDPDEIEEAASLAALAQESIPEPERFGAGIAAGEMRTLGEGGGMAKLGWGTPLVAAALLARDARAGEVLIDGALLAQRGTELRTLGFRVSGERRQLLPAARNSLPPPAPVSVPALSRRSVPPPPPPRVLQQSYPFGPPSSAPAPMSSRGAGLEGGDHTAELARQALLQGNMAALDLLLEKLRVTGEHAELVERMAGLVALRRGATAEGLRRLRDAAESVKEPAQQARSRLAYGVALAAAGRTEGALLEALEALSRARAGGDAVGERACALFLARLSASAGHAAAASAWVVIAQGARG
jgi:hypothetical protein